jgi:putative transposase
MKKKRFSVEQMIGVLKLAQVGVPVAEVIRKAGISEQTFYRWKAKYAGLEVDQVRQMAQLHEENSRLKQLVAELTLDKTMLRDVLPPQQATTACRGPRPSKNGKAFAAWTDGGASGREFSSERTARLWCPMRAPSDLSLLKQPRSTD